MAADKPAAVLFYRGNRTRRDRSPRLSVIYLLCNQRAAAESCPYADAKRPANPEGAPMGKIRMTQKSNAVAVFILRLMVDIFYFFKYNNVLDKNVKESILV